MREAGRQGQPFILQQGGDIVVVTLGDRDFHADICAKVGEIETAVIFPDRLDMDGIDNVAAVDSDETGLLA